MAFVPATAWRVFYTCVGQGTLTLKLTSPSILEADESTGCSSPGPYGTQEYPASQESVHVQVSADGGVTWNALIEEQD